MEVNPGSEIDDLIWKIMIRNPSVSEIDRVIAINGILSGQYLDGLTNREHDDIVDRSEIGIKAYNDQLMLEYNNDDWRTLPKISGKPDENS